MQTAGVQGAGERMETVGKAGGEGWWIIKRYLFNQNIAFKIEKYFRVDFKSFDKNKN